MIGLLLSLLIIITAHEYSDDSFQGRIYISVAFIVFAATMFMVNKDYHKNLSSGVLRIRGGDRRSPRPERPKAT